MRAGNRRSSGCAPGAPWCSSATRRAGITTSTSRTTSLTWKAPSWCARSTKDPATPSCCRIFPAALRSCSIRSRCGSSGFAEEAQLEDRAPALRAVPGADAAAEALHGGVAKREAQPATRAGRGGGEERLEEAREHRLGNAGAVVLDRDHHRSVRLLRGDLDARSPGARRVGEEVDEHLREVVLLAAHRRQIARERRLECHARVLRRHRGAGRI